MNISIIDLDRNTTLDKNAMTDLLGGVWGGYPPAKKIFSPLGNQSTYAGWAGYPEATKAFNPWGNQFTSAGRPRRTNVFLIGG